MHLDEERLQRLLHDELPAGERGAALEHATQCAECRGRLEAARAEDAEVSALLRALDAPVPAATAGSIAVRAKAASGRARLRWAAGFLLALGVAGVAYAVPGSPIGRWIDGLLGRPGPPSRSQETTTEPRGTPAPASGIALPPGDRLRIDFVRLPHGGSARVSLVEGSDVAVRAPAGTATFTLEPGRIVIESLASAPVAFEIDIPRAAPHVEIRTGSNRILLKEGSRIVPEAAVGPGGFAILDLSPPKPE